MVLRFPFFWHTAYSTMPCCRNILWESFHLDFSLETLLFAISMLEILATLILLDCLKIYWQRVKIAKLSKVPQRSLHYRGVQVLSILCNDIQQSIMTTAMVVICIVFHSISLSALIRLTRMSHMEALSQPNSFAIVWNC